MAVDFFHIIALSELKLLTYRPSSPRASQIDFVAFLRDLTNFLPKVLLLLFDYSLRALPDCYKHNHMVAVTEGINRIGEEA